MRLRLVELQKSDKKTWKSKVKELKENWEKDDEVLDYQGQLFCIRGHLNQVY